MAIDRQPGCRIEGDVAYADEAGRDLLPMRLKFWLEAAFDLAGTVETLAGTAIATRRRALERRQQIF